MSISGLLHSEKTVVFRELRGCFQKHSPERVPAISSGLPGAAPHCGFFIASRGKPQSSRGLSQGRLEGMSSGTKVQNLSHSSGDMGISNTSRGCLSGQSAFTYPSSLTLIGILLQMMQWGQNSDKFVGTSVRSSTATKSDHE